MFGIFEVHDTTALLGMWGHNIGTYGLGPYSILPRPGHDVVEGDVRGVAATAASGEGDKVRIAASR